uniref:Cadherin 24 n=1 Tax=Scleropages formosus TaxID=113540 RepID=A0A8D0CIA9_SCLFO
MCARTLLLLATLFLWEGFREGETRSRSRRSWIWNQFFVIEEYSGPEPVLIGRLRTDMDKGDGRTRYVLRGEGAGSVFVIDEKTGNIHVTKPLDREEKDEYRLVATATDRQTDRALEPSSQFIIRVQDINDNPPIFQDGPYGATIPEMANIGTSIIQVTATDADDPTYGNSAKLVYTLTQGQQYFSVDPQTGILRTAVPDMDRETQDQYLVVLQAKDMGGHLGGLSGTTTVTVRLSDVNDNPPRFTHSSWSFSVSELALPGAEVGRLSATDADLGDNAKMEFGILDGEGSDTFNITGRSWDSNLGLLTAVDYESRRSYSFAVEVLNPTVDPRFLRRGPFKDRASVRVTVLDADEPPRFSRARYLLDVYENCPPPCPAGRVDAVDPDSGLSSSIRFSIDPQSDPETLFRIAPDSGLITTAAELDREHERWHNITVIATQRGQGRTGALWSGCGHAAVPLRSDSPTQVSRAVVAIETLDVNDNAPELDRQYSAVLCDSAAVGQVVQVLRAVDKDRDGNDSVVHFSIAPESRASRNFSIRESGASLVLQSPLPPLSRSPASILALQVPLVLRDGDSNLSSTGTLTVSVCPCVTGSGKEATCLPLPSASPSPGLSTAALLAILACVATLLAVSALSLSLRRQKRDSLSPLEEDDVRENIITYDDEGGGEADTAAFDIAALQSAPHSTLHPPEPGPVSDEPLGPESRFGSTLPAPRSHAVRPALLQLRLAQVTFDPSLPPYDSVQIYGFEGEGSRAGSLSSLGSEGDKEAGGDWGGGPAHWGPQFQRLAELLQGREREPPEEREGEREPPGLTEENGEEPGEKEKPAESRRDGEGEEGASME